MPNKSKNFLFGLPPITSTQLHQIKSTQTVMLSCKSSGWTSCTLALIVPHISLCFSHVVRFAYNVVNFLAFLWYFLVFLSACSSLNSTRFIYMNKNNIWAVSVARERDKKKSFNLENVSICVHANRRRKIDDILGRLLLATVTACVPHNFNLQCLFCVLRSFPQNNALERISQKIYYASH